MDDETLELELATVFTGLDQAREYEAALARIAAAQDQVRQGASGMASQVRSLANVQDHGSARSRNYATAATGGSEGDSYRFPTGPAQRLAQAQKDARAARFYGQDASIVQDMDHRVRKAQEAYDRAFPGASLNDSKFPMGPAQRLAQAQKDADRARLSGQDASVVQDMDHRARKAKEAYDRAFPKESTGITGQIGNFLSQRFPKVAGMMGGAASAGGGAAAALGVAGLAALGVKMLADAAVEGARRLKEYADAAARPSQEIAGIREVSGGSLSESAQLRAFGLTGERARSLTDRIASDPFAKAAAGRMGVQALPGPYGTLDTARTTIGTIEGLRRIKNEEEALRQARILNAEDLLKFRRVSEATFQQMRRDAELTGRINDAPQVRRSAEYEASLSRLQAAQENAKVALSTPILEGLSDLFNGIADVVNGFASLAKQNQQAISGLAGFMQGAGMAALNAMPGGAPVATALGIAKARGEAKRQEGAAETTSPQVMALQANTEAILRLTQRIGGGARSRSAIPEALADGRNLSRAINTGHLALGSL